MCDCFWASSSERICFPWWSVVTDAPTFNYNVCAAVKIQLLHLFINVLLHDIIDGANLYFGSWTSSTFVFEHTSSSHLLFKPALLCKEQPISRKSCYPSCFRRRKLEQLLRADPNMFLPRRSRGSRETATQAWGEDVTSTQKSTSLDLTSDFLLCNIVATQRLSVRTPRRLGDLCWSQLIKWEAAGLWLNSSWPRLQTPNLTGWQHFEISASQWTQRVGNIVWL